MKVQSEIINDTMIRLMPMTVYSGEDIEDFVTNVLRGKMVMLSAFLSSYAKKDLFEKWIEIIRCVDVLLNKNIAGIPNNKILKEEERLVNIHKELVNSGNPNIDSNCMLFYQNNRSYIVAMLRFISLYCDGKKSAEENDIVKIMNHCTEIMRCCTTGCKYKTLNKCLNDFEIEFSNSGKSKSNYDFQNLETIQSEYGTISAMEPVQLSVVDIQKYLAEKICVAKLRHSRKSIYSYEELKDNVHNYGVEYDFFGINEIQEYKEIVCLTASIEEFIKDDYLIIIPKGIMKKISDDYPNLVLCNECCHYYDIINTKSPFVECNDTYYSNVLLLNRYYYNLINSKLMKRKRYQIHSGFVFEKIVSKELEKYGFKLTGIKRIQRKEFDVVCIKDGIIYNFQCKNNATNIAMSGDDLLRQNAQRNKQLCSYYEKALRKEENRRTLLTEKLGVLDVREYLISRFPIITRNERIINFNKLEELLRLELL